MLLSVLAQINEVGVVETEILNIHFSIIARFSRVEFCLIYFLHDFYLKAMVLSLEDTLILFLPTLQLVKQ